jgi:hypothetical protein
VRIQAIANWPPESEGDKAIATKWFALAKGGVLFLAEKPATSNNKYVPVVSVPLAGCSIHIPTEGLRGKSKCATPLLPWLFTAVQNAISSSDLSTIAPLKPHSTLHRWWKKCPLEISHPEKELLSQQRSFFLFASDGFAKTQW